MRGHDAVSDVAIDLGEASWDYESAAVSARPGWYRRLPAVAVVATAALGLLSGADPASVPARVEPLWSSASSIPGLAVSPSAVLVGEPGSIVARDPRTGNAFWRAPVQGDVAYVDFSIAGLVVAFSYSPTQIGSAMGLTVIDERTGRVIADLSESEVEAQYPFGRSGDVLLLRYDAPRRDFYDACPSDLCTVLTALDLRDGTIVWSYESRQPEDLLVSTVDGQVAALAFVGREGRVTVVDPTDGSVQSVLDVGPVELGMAALVDGNVITLDSSSGRAVVRAYGIRERGLVWHTTLESPGGFGHVFPCDQGVCVSHATGFAVLDGRTGRVVDTRPDHPGVTFDSGVRVAFVEHAYSTDRGTVAVVTDREGRVLRRIDRVLPVSSGEAGSPLLLRRGAEGVDVLRVDGSGEIRWLGQLPDVIEWCEAHGPLMACWSEDQPPTGMSTNGRVWVWRLPHNT